MKSNKSITLTIDLEDPSEAYAPDGRYVFLTKRILDMCDELERKATFFVVGRIAYAAPELVKEIAAHGHEVAYHSHSHVPLTLETPARMKNETSIDKDKLEQITGKQVVGYRAPQYSLTPNTKWALDILGELGFKYSSSIMPTKISRFGFPNTPTIPFKWPNGMIEFPLPVKKIGPLAIPYSGGIYLYLLPNFISRAWLQGADDKEVLWTYAHPYDFDKEEAFHPMPNTPLWMSAVLWTARRLAEDKIKLILRALSNAPSLEHQVNKSDCPPISL